MAGITLSGLNGLDTGSIVEQLMKLEAVPQSRLKTQLTSAQSAQTTLQGLNTQVAALATQAKELAEPKGWQTLGVTSSSTDVAVRGTTGGVPSSFEVTVDRVATAHRLSFAATARTSDVVVTGGTTVQLEVGGTTRTLETGDGTLGGLVSALNASGTGLRATTVRLDDGSNRLVVTAADTGSAGAFTLTQADGSDLLSGATVRAGEDARVTIGGDTVTSASNTFGDTVPGVAFTVTPASVGTTVQVTSAVDGSAVGDKVAKLVESVNAALSRIDALSSYNATTRTAGVLARETAVRGTRDDLLDSIYPEGGGSLASLGIQTTRDGRLVFDRAAFDKAYAADPAATQAAFTGTAAGATGFASRVQRAAEAASDPYDGTLSAAVVGRGQSIERLEDRISDWDARLELRRTTLARQYTALDTALSQLNSQSSWLSSQLGSLSSGS